MTAVDIQKLMCALMQRGHCRCGELVLQKAAEMCVEQSKCSRHPTEPSRMYREQSAGDVAVWAADVIHFAKACEYGSCNVWNRD